MTKQKKRLTAAQLVAPKIRALKAADKKLAKAEVDLKAAKDAENDALIDDAEEALIDGKLRLEEAEKALVGLYSGSELGLLDALTTQDVEQADLSDARVQKITGKVALVSDGTDIRTLGDIDALRLDSAELEARISALLDHLTARRIAEEMDTPTYLFRLRAFFDRAEDRAARLQDSIVRGFIGVIDDLLEEVEALSAKITERIPKGESQIFLSRTTELRKQNQNECNSAKNELTRLRAGAQKILDDLSNFQAVLDLRNRDRSADIAAEVSDRIETRKGVRWLPLIVAFLTMAFFKLVLSMQGSILIAQTGTYLLIVVFAVAYLLSLSFGMTFRTRVMERLHDHFVDCFRTLFAPGWKNKESFRIAPVWLIKRPPLNGFQRFMDALKRSVGAPFRGTSKHASYRKSQLMPYPADFKFVPRLQMVFSNLAVMFLPVGSLMGILVLQGHVLPISPEFERAAYAFVGSDKNGDDCVVQEGLLTHMDDDHYYVLRGGVPNAIDFRRILPEFYSEALSKAAVRSVINEDTRSARLPDCIQPSPEREPLDPQVSVFCMGCTTGEKENNGVTEARVREIIDNADAKDITLVLDALTTGLDKLALAGPNVTTVFVPLPKDRGTEVQDTPSTNIFETHVVVEGRTVLVEPNMQVLFPFPDDVTGTDNVPSKAFEFGLSSYQDALNRKDENALLLELQSRQLSDVLRRWLAIQPEDIALDVRGYATSEWVNVTSDKLKGKLNHALAEGRRAAVLRHLEAELGEAATRVWVSTGEKRSCVPLTKSGSITLGKRELLAFSNANEMRETLNRWQAPFALDVPDSFRTFVTKATRVEVLAKEKACGATQG